MQNDHSNSLLPSTRLLSPAEVKHYFGFPVLRLQEWRVRGGGPTWYKIGRSIFYRAADIEAFVAASAVEPREARDAR